MKLIHTADWHLCSPMECRLSEDKAKMRRTELLSRFSDMVTWAEDNDVDAVLLCGDLSDDGMLPYHVQDYLLSCMADAAPIRFFLIAGNHDRISDRTIGGCFTRGRTEIPANLTIFGEEWSSAALSPDTVIYGRSLTAAEHSPDLPVMASDKYNIVMLHGEISESSSVLGGEGEILPLTALRGKNIDYLALGHEHTFRHKKLDARGTWCYPGCPEGRGFDECGHKGFVVLTLDGTHCTGASFVPFAKRTLHDLRLDVTDLEDGIYASEQALGVLVRDIPAADLVRITLCGEQASEQGSDIGYLSHRLRERFFHAELRDARTVSEPSVSEGDVSLRAAFIRAVASHDLSEDEKNAVLRCGLAALGGRIDDTLPREEDAT